jgi:hypothetical protein
MTDTINRNKKILAMLAWVCVVGCPTFAMAQDCDEGERARLANESRDLAKRNAWSGVERAYNNLLATGCSLSFDDHELGAESAEKLGKTFQVYERLAVAREIDQRSKIVEEMESINQQFGRVRIKGDPRFRPELVRESMPFAPNQRKSIEYAMQVVANTGSFEGMLPRGEYQIGTRTFMVEPGEEWQEIFVDKVKGRGEDQPLLRYINAVAGLGPSMMFAAEPGDPRTSPGLVDGVGTFAPESVVGGGASFESGVEMGFSYREPALGMAVTLTYDGSYGGHTFHTTTGWLGVTVRPEEWRFVVGPTYSMSFVEGRGVASWFDLNQEELAEDIEYRGVVRAAGMRAGVGYGLIDLDKLRGLVQFDLAWRTDASRSYVGAGIRFGIVPTVPRFKG